jgi:hypothetical protein
MRATRVRTPDGHVWLVWRQWAQRDTALGRSLARRRARRKERWIREGKELDVELAGPDSPRWMSEVQSAQWAVTLISLATALAVPAVLGLLGWLIATRLVPLLPHPSAVAWGLGALTLLGAAALLVNRPWLVVAERQGLHPPRRVWRIRGWWRSRRCRRDLVRAIALGSLDPGAGAAPERHPPYSRFRIPGVRTTGPPTVWLEPHDDNRS